MTYLNVSLNRTPLMTFDPNIPTHITFPLLQGISTPHMNLIRLCVKKIWMTQKVCTKSLTHWLTDWHTDTHTHTKHAAIRSYLADDLMRKGLFFFLCFSLFKTCNLFWYYQNGNFLPGKSISRREKNQEKLLCPLWKIFLLHLCIVMNTYIQKLYLSCLVRLLQ